MVLEMADRVIIVTGSSAGFGKETALLLAKQGARLTIHGRRADKLQEVADAVEKLSGHKPVSVLGSIEDQAVRTEMVDKTVERFGRIDGLVNNAGWAVCGGWEETSLEDMQTMYNIHVLGPYDLCRRCLPQLIKTKGAIVNVSSIAGLRGIGDRLAYGTAKFAMEGLTKCLAVNVAKSGVRVNSVCPAVFATDIFRNDELDLARGPGAETLHPNGRIGNPTEIAESVAFLLKSELPMLSGVSLPVDGCTTSAVMWK